MAHLIDKDALIVEIERRRESNAKERYFGRLVEDNYFLDFLNTLEVKDPYEQCVQYDSIKAGIQAHAETYSFNIESELFNQLTKEQQKLWRKEIAQAFVSGGDAAVKTVNEIIKGEKA